MPPGAVFDGFMHRPYDESIDGWMREVPDVSEYPSVQAAQDTLALFERVQRLTRENWELRQALNRLQPNHAY